MSRKKTLSISDIAEQLNTGKVSIKFLLKRFSKWLPYELIDGQPLYSASCIKKIILIQENLDAGILLDDIEKKLYALPDSDISDPSHNNLIDTLLKPSENGDIRISNDGVSLLKSLINDIGEQQKRIAVAHEKRADAEDRKASAIEKRAVAEEKKAEAMNNIAFALQEMNQLRGSNSETVQIAQQAATVISIDEDDNFQNENLKTTADHKDVLENIQIDDLSLLIEDEQNTQSTEESLAELDDLSLLIDVPKVNESKDIKQKGLDSVELDNLSLLIEEPTQEIDDLSALIDDKPDDKTKSDPLDDLSALIDDSDSSSQNSHKDLELDDLSSLIDKPSDSSKQPENMDDLSLLIDEDSSENIIKTATTDIEIDDLSALIDSDDDQKQVEKIPEIKLDITPEEDLGKYKAAVMKIIIGFKNDNLNAEETTNLLNKNKIKTLSGKPKWGQKAISQIYKFIDSAK